jgi:hypothetical protein
MSTFGKRRRGGVNAGRKAEMLTDPISGVSKNVYFGQRWLCVIQQHDKSPLLISAWHTEEEAKRHMKTVVQSMEYDVRAWHQMDARRHLYQSLSLEPPHGRPDVHYVVEGKVTGK